jgi:hypothetical protein
MGSLCCRASLDVSSPSDFTYRPPFRSRIRVAPVSRSAPPVCPTAPAVCAGCAGAADLEANKDYRREELGGCFFLEQSRVVRQVRKLVGSLGAALVAGLRLPVLPRGAGRSREESGRPTWWPCVRRGQRQPADGRWLPVAPHRATGKQDPPALLSRPWFGVRTVVGGDP